MRERLAVIKGTDPVSCSHFLSLFLFIHHHSMVGIYILFMSLALSLLTQVNNNLQLQGFPLHFHQDKTWRGKNFMTPPSCYFPAWHIQITVANTPYSANAAARCLPKKRPNANAQSQFTEIPWIDRALSIPLGHTSYSSNILKEQLSVMNTGFFSAAITHSFALMQQVWPGKCGPRYILESFFPVQVDHTVVQTAVWQTMLKSGNIQ